MKLDDYRIAEGIKTSISRSGLETGLIANTSDVFLKEKDYHEKRFHG